MAILFFLLAIIFGVAAYKCYDKANKIENDYTEISPKSNDNQHENSQPSIKATIRATDKTGSSVSNNKIADDLLIEYVERYSSWYEYQSKYPLRAKAIRSLGIDLASQSDDDASECIFAIETLAFNSTCKISELKKKFYEGIEKENPTDADWIYVIKEMVDLSNMESTKYNLKVGNTPADILLLFIFDKIKEIEGKYVSSPKITKSDPLTLQMRFMLDSDDGVLMLQKLHIYLRKYPMTEESRKYRENWHEQMMLIIEKKFLNMITLKAIPPFIIWLLAPR